MWQTSIICHGLGRGGACECGFWVNRGYQQMAESNDWKSGTEECLDMFPVSRRCVLMKEGDGKKWEPLSSAPLLERCCGKGGLEEVAGSGFSGGNKRNDQVTSWLVFPLKRWVFPQDTGADARPSLWWHWYASSICVRKLRLDWWYSKSPLGCGFTFCGLSYSQSAAGQMQVICQKRSIVDTNAGLCWWYLFYNQYYSTPHLPQR